MKKFVVLFLIAFSLTTVSNAQDYNTGIGLRAGFSNGLTVKHFIGSNTALEGIVSSRWRGINITGLFEIQNQLGNTRGLNWYFGFGGHIGFWDGDYAKWGDSGESYTVIGLDGILGIEYNFNEIPLNIGVDWKPTFNIFGYSGFWGDGGALSIRYIF